jgi:hypothetical protein
MALGSIQPLTEMSTRNLRGHKWRPAGEADNLTAICEPIVCKMWEPRYLTPLWAFGPVTGIALPLRGKYSRRAGWCHSNALDMCSDDVHFESRTGQRISLFILFVVSLQASQVNSWMNNTSLKPQPLSSISFLAYYPFIQPSYHLMQYNLRYWRHREMKIKMADPDNCEV